VTEKDTGLTRIGPPQPLPLPPGEGFASSRDGRVHAAAARVVSSTEAFAGLWIARADRPDAPLALEAGGDVGRVAVSPDGALVASVEHKRGAVKVWNARTGRLVRQFSNGGRVDFSPNGRYLAVGGTHGGLFAVDSWQEQTKLGAAVRFAPDNRTVAIAYGSTGIALRDLRTGQEWVRIEDPHRHGLSDYFFSADCTRLLTMDSTQGVHAWDLARLRRQLAERGLDWEGPAYPDAPAPTAPLRLALDMGEYRTLSRRVREDNYRRAIEAAPGIAVRWYLRAKYYIDEHRHDSAAADLRHALALNPNFDLACDRLAFLLATAPPPVRDANEAIALAERAVKLRPNVGDYVATQGIAYYSAGRYANARAALERSLKEAPGLHDAVRLCWLALCHGRQGELTQARTCRDRARAWQREHPDWLDATDERELHRLHREIDALLAAAP
jgi:tetratricopeptide (TPR) repeat protein